MKTATAKSSSTNWLDMILRPTGGFGFRNEDGTFDFCREWMTKFGAIEGKPCRLRVSKEPKPGYRKFMLYLNSNWNEWDWATLAVERRGNIFASSDIDDLLTQTFPDGYAEVWVKITPIQG